MPQEKKYKWVKIADAISELKLPDNGMGEIEVDGKKICVALHNNLLMACTQKCPHAGGTLSHGYVDAFGNIVCPIHRYKFNLHSGKNVSGEGYFLKIFPVEQRADGIFIGLQENNMFSWLK